LDRDPETNDMTRQPGGQSSGEIADPHLQHRPTDQTNRPLAVPLPGDLSADVAIQRMIRVDHAGEYGAARIYAGQLAILGRSAKADLLRHMQQQEQEHLDTFNSVLADRHVRPTALLPFWHLAGFALGAATAALGERAAMACTVAVEETIDAHYTAQINRLADTDAPLRGTLEKFRADEREHRDIALANEAEQAPGYRLLSAAIRTGCRIAIRLSERL
jgi:ubiquinone biosynthesis monooxygenase Coq7